MTGLARRAYGLSFPEPYLAPAARPQPPRSKADEPIYRHDGPFAYGVEPTQAVHSRGPFREAAEPRRLPDPRALPTVRAETGLQGASVSATVPWWL